MRAQNRFRWAWLALAWLSLGVGLVGVFLPVMPTAPFVLLAAYAAARGSRKLHFRLLRDKHFGPMIRGWYRHGAVPRRAKLCAIAAMFVSATLAWIFLPYRPAAWAVLAIMTLAAAWLWLRPEGPGR